MTKLQKLRKEELALSKRILAYTERLKELQFQALREYQLEGKRHAALEGR